MNKNIRLDRNWTSNPNNNVLETIGKFNSGPLMESQHTHNECVNRYGLVDAPPTHVPQTGESQEQIRYGPVDKDPGFIRSKEECRYGPVDENPETMCGSGQNESDESVTDILSNLLETGCISNELKEGKSIAGGTSLKCEKDLETVESQGSMTFVGGQSRITDFWKQNSNQTNVFSGIQMSVDTRTQ